MPRTLEGSGVPVLDGALTVVFYQSPCTHVELLLGLAPVIEDDLLKDLSAFIIKEMVQFDKIDFCTRDSVG